MSSSKEFNWDDSHFSDLVVDLDEINRETRSTDEPLYTFVDMGFVNRLSANRHHVIYGRRGAGKSAVLRALESQCEARNKLAILVDIESIAQKSYPNLLVEILKIILRTLHTYHVNSNIFKRFGRRSIIRELDKQIEHLDKLLERQDEIGTKIVKDSEREFGLGPKLGSITEAIELAATGRIKKGLTVEETQTWEKIQVLYNGLETYRGLLTEALSILDYDTIFLLIDDYYQVNLLHQPIIVDYLKRLFRGIRGYLKIATVRNRSLLFIKDECSEAGLQAEQDYAVINLDFSLNNFEQAQGLLTAILRNATSGHLGPLEPLALFDGDGMGMLTEASGGNPRDFINLMAKIILQKQLGDEKDQITQANIQRATSELFKETLSEARKSLTKFDLVDTALRTVISVCQKNKDIAFYFTRSDIRHYPSVHAVFGQLVDSRFVHLIDTSYSDDSDFSTSIAYVLSMGIYTDFIDDKTIHLIKRKNNQKPYPQVSFEQLSAKLLDIPVEYELIAQTLDY